MIKLAVTNEKNLELTELEKVHVGENKFGYYLIFLPEILNGYNLNECEVKLIQVFEDDTSVAIDIDTTQEMRPIKEFITLDATSQAQMVTLSVLITHNGDVIGKTNQKTYQVYPTKNFTPIDPREELDKIIEEQRAEIAEQAETISTQGETITQQSEQITELNDEITEKDGQITELNTENTRLENLTDTQRETIQNMLDNPPQPKLYTPPEPIIPESETRVYTPPQNYDGFASFTVDRVTAEGVGFNPGYYKEYEECLGEAGTYNPFPEHSYGGIYYTELGEGGYPKKILIKDMLRSASTIPQFFNTSNDAKRELREVVFENCPEFLATNNIFSGFNYLTKVKLPNSLTSIGNQAFYSCTSLTELSLPNSLTSIGNQAFYSCTSLTKLSLPNSLTSIGSGAFYNCTSLTNLTLAQGFNCNGLDVHWSTRFTAETIVACLEALADRTGETAYTITFGTTNLNKLTAEQKAIATNKNWNLA